MEIGLNDNIYFPKFWNPCIIYSSYIIPWIFWIPLTQECVGSPQITRAVHPPCSLTGKSEPQRQRHLCRCLARHGKPEAETQVVNTHVRVLRMVPICWPSFTGFEFCELSNECNKIKDSVLWSVFCSFTLTRVLQPQLFMQLDSIHRRMPCGGFGKSNEFLLNQPSVYFLAIKSLWRSGSWLLGFRDTGRMGGCHQNQPALVDGPPDTCTVTLPATL